MIGTAEFVELMRRVMEKIMALHEMEEDWIAAEAVLYEISRLAASAAKTCGELARQCPQEPVSARPVLGPE